MKKLTKYIFFVLIFLVSTNVFAGKSSYRIFKAIEREDYEYLKKYLRRTYNAPLNKKNKLGDTPLTAAIIKGNRRSVSLLLRNGADVNQLRNPFPDLAEQPLLLSAFNLAIYKGEISIARLLLRDKNFIVPPYSINREHYINFSLRHLFGLENVLMPNIMIFDPVENEQGELDEAFYGLLLKFSQQGIEEIKEGIELLSLFSKIPDIASLAAMGYIDKEITKGQLLRIINVITDKFINQQTFSISKFGSVINALLPIQNDKLVLKIILDTYGKIQKKRKEAFNQSQPLKLDKKGQSAKDNDELFLAITNLSHSLIPTIDSKDLVDHYIWNETVPSVARVETFVQSLSFFVRFSVLWPAEKPARIINKNKWRKIAKKLKKNKNFLAYHSVLMGLAKANTKGSLAENMFADSQMVAPYSQDKMDKKGFGQRADNENNMVMPSWEGLKNALEYLKEDVLSDRLGHSSRQLLAILSTLKLNIFDPHGGNKTLSHVSLGHKEASLHQVPIMENALFSALAQIFAFDKIKSDEFLVKPIENWDSGNVAEWVKSLSLTAKQKWQLINLIVRECGIFNGMGLIAFAGRWFYREEEPKNASPFGYKVDCHGLDYADLMLLSFGLNSLKKEIKDLVADLDLAEREILFEKNHDNDMETLNYTYNLFFNNK